MNRTKLTRPDITRIRQSPSTNKALAEEFDLHPSYISKLRSGAKNPEPYVPAEVSEPRSQGKPRSLTSGAVSRIQAAMGWYGRTAEAFSAEYGVSKATVYKARGRKGCYNG